jgi:exodeoxyribonuclease-3
MKIITYNVNGLRANVSKSKNGDRIDDVAKSGLAEIITIENPDILALQETRCPDSCLDMGLFSEFVYKRIESSKERKGYSGVAILSKEVPINDLTHLFPKEFNVEGRLIALEYDNFVFINTYTPNTKQDLSRLNYRANEWEPTVRNFIQQISNKKPIIFVSDFNVAPAELDIYTTRGKDKSNGFTKEERNAFGSLLKDCDLINSFRELHPTEKKYSWFSPIINKRRDLSKGWLIDMILISKTLKNKLKQCDILSEYYGSDHKPVYAEIETYTPQNK